MRSIRSILILTLAWTVAAPASAWLAADYERLGAADLLPLAAVLRGQPAPVEDLGRELAD